MSDTDANPHVLYSEARDELIAALVALDDAAASRLVPSCPEWTVKDVAAHLCGLNAEKLAGVQGRLGTDEATVRQVADRSGMTLPQIVDEWRALAEPIRELMATDQVTATAFLADLVVHVYDLAEVLGQTAAAAAAATPISAHRYVPLLQERVAERMALALDIELTDGTAWPAPEGSADQHVTLRATPHDFLRSVTGRRTRADVEALDWSVDPAEILDNAWNQYGPFRA